MNQNSRLISLINWQAYLHGDSGIEINWQVMKWTKDWIFCSRNKREWLPDLLIHSLWKRIGWPRKSPKTPLSFLFGNIPRILFLKLPHSRNVRVLNEYQDIFLLFIYQKKSTFDYLRLFTLRLESMARHEQLMWR